MKKRPLLVCDSCGCISCECDPDNPHSPGEKHDHFDNDNYDPWCPVDCEEPSIEELTALLGLAAA
jgi:hypothetical protein